MKTIHVPGYGPLDLKNAVFDLNGTLTESGDFVPGVMEGLKALQRAGLKIYVLSGDTRGTLHDTLEELSGIEAVVTKTAADKRRFVESLGPENTVCIGNGNIDEEMFQAAKLSICTLQAEGATTRALLEADILVTHIRHALEILLDPDKIVATLRS